jgi:3-methyladenine DNA glycosylase AlkD
MIALNTIKVKLEKEIARQNRPENLVNYQQFFKEPLAEPIGLRGSVLKQIANLVYKEINDAAADEILDLCDQLLATDMRYRMFIAFDWTVRQKQHFRPAEFKRFERWLKKYVDNWGACDSLCCGPIGLLLAQFPDMVTKTHPWRKAKNRWLRRASAVSLIVPVRQGTLLNEVFSTADTLLMDQDDMIQKGYGWMLKEATKRFPDEVFAYVMKHKARMPRTALRYAIEKMPEKRRKQAMAK